MLDQYFKERYIDFSNKWYSKFGWYLFKPLSEDDKHHFKSLHRPLPDNRKDFDEQVASIVKIIIESLNEGELVKVIKDVDLETKGIDKLEVF